MTATIYCIRHGQGLHNLGKGNYELPDPKMTPLGVEQCMAARDLIAAENLSFSLITASPLSRTLHSASIIFAPWLAEQPGLAPILALPDLQETSDDPCDIGSDLSVLSTRCAENMWPVNLSLLDDGWNDKTIGTKYSPASKAIAARAREARCLLRFMARQLIARGEKHVNIGLVTHGSFLHYFTGDWEHAALNPATGWRNCEMRSYTFEAGVESCEPDAVLVEADESRRKRGLDYPMIARTKQQVLYEQTMQAWEDQGLQNPAKVGL